MTEAHVSEEVGSMATMHQAVRRGTRSTGRARDAGTALITLALAPFAVVTVLAKWAPGDAPAHEMSF
ncbi:hypothetical protein QDR37_03585 [Amnibacterium sp. CER49]|uniref:hypothetical protein n=1 Tax=Amnibacterium sp. CER49 TaxID=3039161 RepID=UPI00244D04FB|nr:hypothetical protein [Amnibacterium sp. CER49]MDH2443022.1 hypothetical protein [Amnibacterium sp. CER49]